MHISLVLGIMVAPMLELTITTRGASREKDDYHLTSQLSDEAFNAMGMAEKQLLQYKSIR